MPFIKYDIQIQAAEFLVMTELHVGKQHCQNAMQEYLMETLRLMHNEGIWTKVC